MGWHGCREPRRGFPPAGVDPHSDSNGSVRTPARWRPLLVRSLFGSGHAGHRPKHDPRRHHPPQHHNFDRDTRRCLRASPVYAYTQPEPHTYSEPEPHAYTNAKRHADPNRHAYSYCDSYVYSNAKPHAYTKAKPHA